MSVNPDLTMPFLQSPEGAVRVAMEVLWNEGIGSTSDRFREVRVVRSHDHFNVHLLGSPEGSYLVEVPRHRRVTRYELELRYLDTHIRLTPTYVWWNHDL